MNLQPVFYVDQATDEPHSTDDDEFEAVPATRGTVVEDTQKRVNPGELQGRGETPSRFENRGVAELGSGGEKEAIGAEERGGGRGIVEVREKEPGVG
ncbi:hypothetical protein V6N13_146968 [Hibiscus sabdariffa]